MRTWGIARHREPTGAVPDNSTSADPLDETPFTQPELCEVYGPGYASRIGTGPAPWPRPIKVALVVLMFLAVGVGYVGYRTLVAPAPSHCFTQPGTADKSEPGKTIARFLVWAAGREAPGVAYDSGVVSKHLAGGASRADWQRGFIPVAYVPHPRLENTLLRTNQPRVFELELLLGSSEPGSAGSYRIILTRACSGPWRVNYFAPSTLFGAPAG